MIQVKKEKKIQIMLKGEVRKIEQNKDKEQKM